MGIGTDVSLEVGSGLVRGGLVVHALMEGIGQGLQRVAQDRRDAVEILAAEVHRGRAALARAQVEAAEARREAETLRAAALTAIRDAAAERERRLATERALATALRTIHSGRATGGVGRRG